MGATDWIKNLNIPQETADALQATSLPDSMDGLKNLFFSNRDSFRETVTDKLTGLQILKLYLLWIEDTKAKYDALGIPETYFWDSCMDFPIWCNDHLVRFGRPDFIEWDWVGKTLRMEVIRIGRLQFEPDVLKHEISVSGQTYVAGTPILHVHIPAGEPLDLAAVLDSMDRAPKFFKQYYGSEFTLFHCHSWLLSPDLKNLLSENSRIMQFKNLFQVYGTDDERQAEERVFGFLSDDPAKYPEKTSLQRTVKEYLLSGNEVKMAVGIRPIQ